MGSEQPLQYGNSGEQAYAAYRRHRYRPSHHHTSGSGQPVAGPVNQPDNMPGTLSGVTLPPPSIRFLSNGDRDNDPVQGRGFFAGLSRLINNNPGLFAIGIPIVAAASLIGFPLGAMTSSLFVAGAWGGERIREAFSGQDFRITNLDTVT